MGNRLRRTSLLPATAARPAVAPVAEPYAFASLSSDLLLRVARDTGSGDDAGDILCRKGSASASRWRSYDHKDTFEPAQAATAPPSDTEELGSWQKYDSVPPAPKGSAKTLSDDEQPTSWFKYETKPIASLLGSIENRRAQSLVALAESTAPASRAVPAAPAVVETAPELDNPAASLAPEPTLIVEVPTIEAKPASTAEIEVEAPASITDLAIEVAPQSKTEPTTVSELPPREADALDLAAAVAEDDKPDLPTSVSAAPAELERSELGALLEASPSALAPSGEQGSALTEAGPPEIPAIIIDEPRSDEPTTIPDVTEIAHLTSGAVHEVPNVGSAVLALPYNAAPLPPQETAAAASEPSIKRPAAGKKAMLARLAQMLEQALSAKRSPTVDAIPTTSSVAERAAVPEAPVAIASEGVSHLTSDISEERPTATIDVILAGASVAGPAAVLDPEVSVASPQETSVEVGVSPGGLGHDDGIETRANAPIEAAALAPAEPQGIESLIHERPIEPEALLAASPEPGVELPAAPLDAIEVTEPPAASEAQSSELSLAPASVEASREIAAPTVELARAELETDAKSPVAPAAETEPAADPVDQTEQHASQPDFAPEVSKAEKPVPARKATPVRLAGMLERALSAKPASAAVDLSTPPGPAPDINASVNECVASMATEAQIPAPKLPVKPAEREAPLALTEPEFAESAPVAHDAVVLEPADVTDEPHTGADFPSSEASVLETDLNLESVPQTPPAHQHAQVEESQDPEAVVAHAGLRDETTTTLALSGEVAEPLVDGIDLETHHEQAAAPSSILWDTPAPPEMQPEVGESAIIAESGAASDLREVSTSVEELPVKAPATVHDAVTASSEHKNDVSGPVQVPASSLEAVPVAPALATRIPMVETPDPIVVATDTSAEPIIDMVRPVETSLPERDRDASQLAPATTPSRDAASVAPEPSAPERENSHTIDLSALTASIPTVDAPEPVIVAAGPIVDVIAPLETTPPEREPEAAEPASEPAPALDYVPTAAEPEIFDAIDFRALAASTPTIETPESVIPAVEASAEPIVDAVAAVETAAAEILPPPATAPAPAAPPPLTPAQQEKAARAALTDDLADVIHNVLSTTQFASRAMKPKRYTEEEPRTDEPELSEFADELAASLPHPVAIPPRFGRMGRGIAWASAALMLVVGYLAFSLWHGAVNPVARAAAPAPAVAATAPHSEDWGERARDMTRGLNSIAVVRDVPKAQAPGSSANADAQPRGPESAQ